MDSPYVRMTINPHPQNREVARRLLWRTDPLCHKDQGCTTGDCGGVNLSFSRGVMTILNPSHLWVQGVYQRWMYPNSTSENNDASSLFSEPRDESKDTVMGHRSRPHGTLWGRELNLDRSHLQIRRDSRKRPSHSGVKKKTPRTDLMLSIIDFQKVKRSEMEKIRRPKSFV